MFYVSEFGTFHAVTKGVVHGLYKVVTQFCVSIKCSSDSS